MSTLALADLSREARRRLGLETDCSHRWPSPAAASSAAALALRWVTASPRAHSEHGTIPVDSNQSTLLLHNEIRPAMNSESAAEVRLFAVCLGGRAPRCRVELHDVAFAVGTDLESIHGQLLDGWFGTADGLHIDAWAVLDQVPGFRVELLQTSPDNDLRLFFVNIGGYVPGEFGERHAWAFYAACGPAEIKTRARRELLIGQQRRHRDDLRAIDDLVEVKPHPSWHIHLIPDPEASGPVVTNGYFPLPKQSIAAWKRRQTRR